MLADPAGQDLLRTQHRLVVPPSWGYQAGIYKLVLASERVCHSHSVTMLAIFNQKPLNRMDLGASLLPSSYKRICIFDVVLGSFYDLI